MIDDESKSLSVPKASLGDAAHTAAKVALGSIPMVGGAAAELLTLVIAPPLERRRNAWMESVAEALRRLQKNGEVDFAKLAENKKFIDAVLRASAIAIRTSNKEKLEALRNAVANTAINASIDDTQLQIFLSLVDDLTPLHLQLLSLVTAPPQWFEQRGKKIPEYFMTSSVAGLVRDAMPKLAANQQMLNLIASDLTARGLASLEGLHTMMSGRGALESRATGLGREFLAFISSPTEGE